MLMSSDNWPLNQSYYSKFDLLLSIGVILLWVAIINMYIFVAQKRLEVLFQYKGCMESEVIIAFVAVLFGVLTVCWHIYATKRLKAKYACLEQARQQAEKELTIKNEFIRNLASDLREPLNPIAGFSDVLTTDNLMPEERKLMSEHIKESSKILSVMIDELAELSFYESKKSLPMTTTVSPNIVCQHMVESLKGICKDGVELRYETTLPHTFEIQTNLEAFQHLLEHLIVSGARYTEQGCVTVACSLVGKNLRINVTDTGRGIPEEEKDNLFEILLHQKNGADVRFTGMSLAISQAIIHLLGGRLWLEKEYKEGTRFTCEFPISK